LLAFQAENAVSISLMFDGEGVFSYFSNALPKAVKADDLGFDNPKDVAFFQPAKVSIIFAYPLVFEPKERILSKLNYLTSKHILL